MKNTIESTMSDLRTDHRNMVMLLDLLDAESLRLAENNEPDYELLDDVLAYMSEYSDAVHHPKEDLIYQHIHARHDNIENSLKHIEADHKALGRDGVEIRNIINATDAQGLPDRVALAKALRRYSEDLRKHMYWEEKDLFALADSMQDNEAWVELLKCHNVARDPLFGNTTERRFRRLFNHLQQRIVWDSQQYFV